MSDVGTWSAWMGPTVWHSAAPSMRPSRKRPAAVIQAAGLGEKTEIEWSDGNRQKAGLKKGKEEVFEIREEWASFTNQKLKELKLEARVDHRSLEAQGIDREPTAHLGVSASGMERRGIRTDVGYRLQAEASARLERASELAALRNESREVEQSILSLDTSISAALAARDAQKGARLGKGLDHDTSMGANRGQVLTPDEIQKAAREKWLAHREHQLEKGQGKGRDIEADQSKELERTKDRSKKHTPDDDFSL